MSTLLPMTPPRIAPAAAPINPPFTLSRLATAPITAPVAAPIAASRVVCFTACGAGAGAGAYTTPLLALRPVLRVDDVRRAVCVGARLTLETRWTGVVYGLPVRPCSV